MKRLIAASTLALAATIPLSAFSKEPQVPKDAIKVCNAYGCGYYSPSQTYISPETREIIRQAQERQARWARGEY